MKKLLAIALAALLAASALSGCGKASSSSSDASPSSDTSPSSDVSSSSDASVASGSSDTGLPEPSGDFARGAWDGDTYANDYLDLAFTLPDGWVAATDEEIANAMQLGSDMLTEEQKFTNDMAKQKSVYEMMAAQDGGGPNLLMMLENLSMTIGGTAYDEQRYADVLTEQFSQLTSMKVALKDTSEAELAGRTYLRVDYDVNDGAMTITYFLRRMDKYMLALCFTGVTGKEPTADQITANFFAPSLDKGAAA